MLIKVAFRLIRTTAKRFISIVGIVFIGVAFMLGLFITPKVMRDSVDLYNEDIKLANAQIYSSYGFCQEDINELKKQDFVEEVFGSKQIDVFADYNNSKKIVIRFREIDSELNSFYLVEGRMPKTANEILLIEQGEVTLPLNTKIKVYLDDSDILDQLKYDEYTIVGYTKSSEYMSRMKSSSNLKNLDLQAVVYANNSIFLNDYYTTLFVKGNKEYTSYFNDEYEVYLKNLVKKIENFATVQQEYYKTTIYEKANKKIEDAEKTLANERSKALAELNDAKIQLDGAKNQINSGASELEAGKQKLINGQKEIDSGLLELEKAKNTLKENEELLNAKEADYNNAIAKVSAQGMTIDEAISQLQTACDSYNSLQNSKNEGLPSDLESAAVGTLRDLKNAQDSIISGLRNTIQWLDEDSPLRQYFEQQLDDAQAISDNLDQQINQAVADAKASYDAQIDASLKEIENQVGGNPNELLSQLQQLKSVDPNVFIDGRKEIENGYKQIDDNKKKLTDAQVEIDEGWKEYYSGVAKYYDGLSQYEDGNNEYLKGVKEFNTKMYDAKIELNKARQELEELPTAKWTILGRESSYANVIFKNACDQMASICLIMPILFYLVAALVCLTTMTRLIDEQRGQIGIYRALGYTKSQILFEYLTYVFIACVIGSLMGIGVGVLIFPDVIYNTWRLLHNLPDLILTIPLEYVLLCVGAFLILISIVTAYVVLRSLNESSASLLRPKAPKKIKKVLAERIPFIWNLFSFTGKITVRNLFRYKSRFIMSVIGVAGCTSLLVLGFGVKDSISGVLSRQYGEILKYQYNINMDSDSNIKEITNILNKDDQTEAIMPYISYYSKVYFDNYDDTVQVCVLDDNKVEGIYDFKNSNNENTTFTSNTVAVTKKYAELNNIKVGDEITFESKEGLKATITVTDIYQMYFQHYLFISEDIYQKMFDIDLHYTSLAVKSNNTLENIDAYLENVDQYSSITSFEGMINQFNTMIQSLNIIIMVIIITAGSLAFVVLFNLIQVNISERIREIATLKVLGFKNREVNIYLFKEIIFLTIVGAILGMPLGKIELKFVMTEISVDFVMFPIDIKFISYIYGFIISFIFTIIVLIYTRKELRNIEMVESLKSVE